MTWLRLNVHIKFEVLKLTLIHVPSRILTWLVIRLHTQGKFIAPKLIQKDMRKQVLEIKITFKN